MTRFVATGSASCPRPLARRALVAAVAAMCLLAAACSDDDSSAAGEAEESTTSSRPTTTSSNEDEVSAAEALRQQIQELLTSYDEVVAEIVADPAVAADRDHPLYDNLRALMVPGSEVIDPVINALVAAGSRGERQVAHREGELPIERQIGGDVEVVSDVEYRVLTCARLSYEVFDRQGEQIAVVDGPVQPSTVTVGRSGDELRIRQFEAVEQNPCSEEP